MEEKIMDNERRLASAIRKVKERASPNNRTTILGFVDDCFIQGLSKGRAIKYAYYLLKMSNWLGKDYKDANKEDLKGLIRHIETSSYAAHTKTELKLTIRKLYMWIEDTEDYPDIVRWIKTRTPGGNKIRLPDQILTKDEILKLIDAARTSRDRAFISTIYDTGARIGEILFLRIRGVEFDKHGAILSIPHFGKTGSRRVRIVPSVPYIQEWLNKHPDKKNPDAYIWLGPHMKCMKYGAVRSLLSRLASRAGITKPVNPHAFRHARATHLASHLTEAQMKIFFGWTMASKMAATYVHLSGRDVDNAILKLHGIQDEQEEKEKDTLEPKACPRCELSNEATNQFCSRCGLPLDDKSATEMLKDDMNQEKTGQLVTQLLKDHQIRDMLMSKIKEMPQR
jgi:site-specific recombinase XerD